MTTIMPQADWEILKQDVETIKKAIVGDDFGNKGIIHRVDALESKVGAITVRVIGVSAFVSGVVWAVKAIIGK